MCLDAEGMWCAENIALTLGEAGPGCQARYGLEGPWNGTKLYF